jgi:uncharacterized RDD family membrane protein YckC
MIEDRYNDRYIIDTPEHVEFGYEIAGIGSRVLAALIDMALVGVILTFLTLVAANVLRLSEPGVAIIVSAAALFVIAYYIIFERLWVGQSPGKRALGIRVVQSEGRPVTMAGSIIRNFIRLIDFFPSFYGIGTISMFMDRRIRRLGDLAAGTLVVQDRQRVTLESLVNAQPPIFAAQPDQQVSEENAQPILPNLHALGAEDLALVNDFLAQRDGLDLPRRQYLANQLAYGLFVRLGYSVPGDPEQFIVRVASDYARINRGL